MPGATIPDASLFTKERAKTVETFDLTFTYEGIDISRPGEPTRHLPWERITEWEIEQRRGGVLLTLRGSGSVTPLIIPNWRVDDLDEVLRDVTSGVPVEEPVPVVEPVVEPAPPVAQEPVPVSAPDPEPVPMPESTPEPVAFSENYAEPYDVAAVWSAQAEVAAPAAEAEAESKAVEPVVEAPVVEEPVVATEKEKEEVTTNLWGEDADQKGLDTVLWPEPRVPRLTGPRPEMGSRTEEPAWSVEAPSFASAIEADSEALEEEDDVDGTLEWPSNQPLDTIPKLEWPSGSDKKQRTEEPAPQAKPEVAAAASTPAPSPPSAAAQPRTTPWVIAEVEDLPPAVPMAMIPVVEPIVRPIAEATPERTFTPPPPTPERTTSAADLLASEFKSPAVRQPAVTTSPGTSPSKSPSKPDAVKPAAAGATAPAPAAPPRTERRKQSKARFSWKSAGTAAALALLAAAVAIVLADSAGAIHFGFLG